MGSFSLKSCSNCVKSDDLIVENVHSTWCAQPLVIGPLMCCMFNLLLSPHCGFKRLLHSHIFLLVQPQSLSFSMYFLPMSQSTLQKCDLFSMYPIMFYSQQSKMETCDMESNPLRLGFLLGLGQFKLYPYCQDGPCCLV